MEKHNAEKPEIRKELLCRAIGVGAGRLLRGDRMLEGCCGAIRFPYGKT